MAWENGLELFWTRVQIQGQNKRPERKLAPGPSLMVPVVGVEPTRYRYHWILSPARLPISPQRQEKQRTNYNISLRFLQANFAWIFANQDGTFTRSGKAPFGRRKIFPSRTKLRRSLAYSVVFLYNDRKIHFDSIGGSAWNHAWPSSASL